MKKGFILVLLTNNHGIQDIEGKQSAMQCGLILTEISSLLILMVKPTRGIFLVSSLGGSMSDGSIDGDSQMDRDWDGDWEVKISESETHWYSEFFLPWTVVPMMADNQSSRSIGVYFSRQMMRVGKVIGFPGINYERKNFLSRFHPVTVNQYKSTKFRYFPLSSKFL